MDSIEPGRAQSPEIGRAETKTGQRQFQLSCDISLAKTHYKSMVMDSTWQIKKIEHGASNQTSSQSAQEEDVQVTPASNNQAQGFYEYDKMFKIILIGQADCGKTCIVNRFVDDTFKPDSLTTIGTDLKSIKLQIDNLGVRLEIWDTAGQEQFQSLTKQFFRRSQGAIAVFDLTCVDSLMKVEQQIANFQANCPTGSQKNVVLVGNKSDLPDERKVKTADAELLAEKLNCLAYYETSAKEGTQIDEVFYSMALACLSMPEEEDGEALERRSTLVNRN